MSRDSTFAAIVGSLRKASLTRAVFEASAAVFERRGITLEEAELYEVPFYNGDVEAAGDPGPVIALKRAVERADGLVVFTPEYNGSVPAVTKNAIDWLSRPHGQGPLAHTPVGIIAQSPGGRGAKGVRAHLSVSVAANTDAFFEETLGIARSRESLATEETQRLLAAWCERFAKHVAASESVRA